MPERTHLEQLEAVRAYVLADSAEARAQALAESLDAEGRHLEALRVERGSLRTTIVGVLVSLLLVATLVVSLRNSEAASDNANIARTAASQATRLTKVLAAEQRSQRLASIENCRRMNESRVASIAEKRQSVRTARKTLHVYRAVLAQAPPGPDPFLALIASLTVSLEEERDARREAIRKTIEAQAEVAIRPGSPVVDCRAASLASYVP